MEDAFAEQTLLEKRCSQLEDKFKKLTQINDNNDQQDDEPIRMYLSLVSILKLILM